MPGTDGTPRWILDEAVQRLRVFRSTDAEGKAHLLRFASGVTGLLAKPLSGNDLKARLAEVESELRQSGAALPKGMREAVERKAAGSPELELVLATDDERRGSGGAALERLIRFMGRLGKSDRVSAAALEAWRGRRQQAGAEVQEELLRAAESGSDDAWAALALIRLESGKAAVADAGRPG
jgi:hypothetical protein